MSFSVFFLPRWINSLNAKLSSCWLWLWIILTVRNTLQPVLPLWGWWPVTLLCVNGIARINKVTLRRAWLVLGWVTMSGFSSRCQTFISVCDQPPMSTQPGHSLVGRHNEYQPKVGEALWLGSNVKYGSCVGGR